MKKIVAIFLLVLLIIAFECTAVYAESFESVETFFPFMDESWPENNHSNYSLFAGATGGGFNISAKFGNPELNCGINLFKSINALSPGLSLETNLKLTDDIQINLGGNLIYIVNDSWIFAMGRAQVEVWPVKFLSIYCQVNPCFIMNETYATGGLFNKFGSKVDIDPFFIKIDLSPGRYMNVNGELGFKLSDFTLIGKISTLNGTGLIYGLAVAI